MRAETTHPMTRRLTAGFVAVLLLAAGLTVITDSAAPSPAAAAQNPTSCPGAVVLTNGSFESPAVAAGTYRLFPESQVPGWLTNDSQNEIELWGRGFQGVPAASGNAFAELNANSASTLYQDVATTPGQALAWSLKHRGRSGTDTMRVMIGAPTGTLIQSGPNLVDSNTAWGTHSGTYTVPAGQTVTRFAFQAVSAAGGNPAIGNFIDDITFGTGPCLITTKSVANLTRTGTTAEVGDTLRYTVTTRNAGGNPALQSVSTDVLAAGLDYVPGSLRITAGGGAGALTDAAGDDRGEYGSGDRTVRVRLGDGGTASTGGSITASTSTTYTFDAKVRVSAAGGTITNEARVGFRDAVANQNRVSTSQETVTPVNPAADLAITKTLDTAPLVAGMPATFTVTAINNGPQVATGVTVTDAIPAGLTGVTATSGGASCVVAAAITCAIPDMAVGASVPIEITGTLQPSRDPGTSLTNTASITGSRTDPNLADNTATAIGTLSASADISVQKTYAPETPVAGQNVTYTITTHNDGPSEARDVAITDPLDPDVVFVSATSEQGTCDLQSQTLSCEIGTMAPDATVITTVVVQIASGMTAVVQNSASATTSTSDPDPTNNVSSTSFQPDVVADLAVVKTASVPQVSAGGTVDFILAVRNRGTSDAVNVVLTDALPAGFTATSVDAPAGAICDAGTGESVRCTWDSFPVGGPSTVVVHAAVSADAPAGTSTNTASVASPADDQNTDDNSSSAEVEVVQSADLGIQKSAPATGEPGSAFTYSLTVTNNGPSLARGVNVTDVLPAEFAAASADLAGCTITAGTLNCQLGDLAPSASATVQLTGTWASTATGRVTNTATVTSGTPDSVEGNNTDSTDVTLVPSADVSLSKTTTTPRVALAGTVSFDITVRNDGPSAAVGIVVEELPGAGITITGATAGAGTWSQPEALWTVGTLLPGDEATLVVTGTADVVGTLANTARASSQTPDPDTDDLSDTAEVVVTPSADLSITKTISAIPAPSNGTVTYTLLVENHGPGTASDFTVTDALPAELRDPATATAECSIVDGSLECVRGALAVGATFTATVTGIVDPGATADELSNTATVSSTTADPVPANNTSTVTVPITGTPLVELVKTAGVPVDATGDGRIGAGDSVAYTFTVQNTGSVTLTGATISDPMLGGDVACEAFAAPLAPGASITCAPVTYTLTQADLDAGTVHNEASVSAQSARGAAEDDAEADVSIPAANAISLDKRAGEVADVDGDGAVSAGDTVDYTFTVTNAGTTTLTNAEVTDPMLGGQVECEALDGVTLAPGQDVACDPVTYTLTQEDIDAGTVHNDASVTADAPIGTVSDTASADVGIVGTASIELRKNAGTPVDTNDDDVIGAGDAIPYTFSVRNSGTTTLTAVTVADPLLSDDALCSLPGPLAPDAVASCGTFDYVLTQDDVESEIVRNTATVDGTSPLGPVTDDTSVDVIVTGTPALSLIKTPTEPVDADEDGRIGAGDTVAYSFVILNTGTTLLRDIVLDDPLLGGVVDCPALDGVELAPQDEVECGPVEYSLTQDDVDAEAVHNTATVEGQSTAGSASGTADADITVAGTDGIELLKSAAAIEDANGSGRTDAGDTVAYTFAVTNTGTTSLRGIAISDPRLDGAIVCDVVTLAPGEATLCEGNPAVLTQSEVDAGEIVNSATASGTGTGDSPVTADDSVTTSIQTQPAVAMIKTGGDYADANGTGEVDAGDTVQFRFTVTNTGAVTLGDVVIDDPKLGGAIACDIPDLAPDESATCGPIAYTLTAADAAAGQVVNVATVSAQAGAVVITAAASTTVDVRALAVTGGVVTGIGWALALLILGLLVIVAARLKNRWAA